jgi:hypothetical protein
MPYMPFCEMFGFILSSCPRSPTVDNVPGKTRQLARMAAHLQWVMLFHGELLLAPTAGAISAQLPVRPAIGRLGCVPLDDELLAGTAFVHGVR